MPAPFGPRPSQSATKTLLVLAHGSLLTGLATPAVKIAGRKKKDRMSKSGGDEVKSTTSHTFTLGDERVTTTEHHHCPQMGERSDSSSSSASSSSSLVWREVDFLQIVIDPTLEAEIHAKASNGNVSTSSHDDDDGSAIPFHRVKRGPKPKQGLGLEPPRDFPKGILTPCTSAAPTAAASSSSSPSLWDSRVSAHFAHGTTIYDVCAANLRTQLELIALNNNLTPYDLLMSPIGVVPSDVCAADGGDDGLLLGRNGDDDAASSTATHAVFTALVAELRRDILPQLIVKEALAAAFLRAGSIMKSEAPLLKPKKQIAGQNVSATVHRCSPLLAPPIAPPSSSDAAATDDGSAAVNAAAAVALQQQQQKTIFMRSKGFCLGIWGLMRAMLLTFPREAVYPPEEEKDNAAAASSAAQWQRLFAFDGLLAFMAEHRPLLFASQTIDGLVALSGKLSPAGIPLDKAAVEAASREMLARRRGDVSSGALEGRHNANDDLFPVLDYIQAVAEVRKRRGVVDDATLPPLYCDLFLLTLVVSLRLVADDVYLPQAVGAGLVADGDKVPDEALRNMNDFLRRVGAAAATPSERR